MPSIFVVGRATSSSADRGHSLDSLAPPQAAVDSLPKLSHTRLDGIDLKHYIVCRRKKQLKNAIIIKTPWLLPRGLIGDYISKGERWERRLWRGERPERVAAVDKIKEKRKPEDFIGHRNRTPGTIIPTAD